MFFSASPRLTWLKHNTTGKSILDIGFAGVYQTATAHQLLRQENQKSFIVAVDINSQLVFKHPVKNAIVASGYHLPLKPMTFDTVVLGEILEHLTSWPDFLTEVLKSAKKTSKIIITTPSPFNIFRLLRYVFLSINLTDKSTIKAYLGAPDHVQYIDPLAICHFLHQKGYKTTLTSRNLNIPYLPKNLSCPPLHFWPFSRMGTYSCIIASK